MRHRTDYPAPAVRIHAIYRHYWPDTTPYARLLRSILERLAEEGHEVSVFTAQPAYNDASAQHQPWSEVLGGVRVRRLPLPPERKSWRLVRALNGLIFLVAAVLHATLWRRFDLVIANGHPPVAMGVALRAIKWFTGTDFVLHLQDLHPEAGATIGALKRGRLYALLRRIDAASCRAASRVVTLSRDMRDSLADRGEPVDRVTIINNCPLPRFEDASLPPPLPPEGSGRARLLFAGNLGHFQALEALAEATHRVRHPSELELQFMGAGALAARLPGIANPGVATFVPRQPLGVAKAAMAAADYGVVSLAPGVIRYAYPSKTLECLAAGTPLFAIVEPWSELAETIRRHKLGIVVEGADPDSIAHAMDLAVARRGEWTPERRREIAAFAEQHFGEARMLGAWSGLVSQVAGARKHRSPAPPSRRAA